MTILNRKASIRLLGIDPGLSVTGLAVVDLSDNMTTFVDSQSIKTDSKADLGYRLMTLAEGIKNFIIQHVPHEAALEETFVNSNGQSTLKLGQARGVALLVPVQQGLKTAEYSPNKIKKTVLGSGHADKKQMQKMISMLFPQARPDNEHEVDALAVAFCHAQHRRQSTLSLRIVN